MGYVGEEPEAHFRGIGVDSGEVGQFSELLS